MSNKLSKATISLHWITAISFLAVLALGLFVSDMPRSPEKFELLGIHKSLGFLVLIIAALRLSWRIKEGSLKAVSPMPRWQSIVAHAVHGLLLLATLSMPISGVIMNLGGGRALDVFGLTIIPAIDKSPILADIGSKVHHASVDIIFVILALHVFGALKHQFWDKDQTITRMLGR